jgi:hypothetical protein
MDDFNKLIPELKRWNNGIGIDVESWIGCVGDFQKAIGYSSIFWPKFVEIEGCVVNASTPIENLKQWLDDCKGDLHAVEAMVNHLHISDIHHAECEDATPERLKYLGSILKDIYECKLKRDFPAKIFRVDFDDNPKNPDHIDDFILTFYQDRNPDNRSQDTS